MSPIPEEDDTPLVEGCIRKDPAAWDALVAKYSALITRSVANRLKRSGFNPLYEDTEDMRQNVLASIWTGGKLENVRNRKSIAYWLAIVSGNTAIEHMRAKMAGDNPKFVPLPEDDADPGSGLPLQEPKKGGLVELLEHAIGMLPPKEQLVIKLNLLDGMGYNEIAGMLNMPKGTVSSYIKRAKEKLKKVLEKF